MSVLYDNEMMKQILEIAAIVEREGVAHFMCCGAGHQHSGHFCGLDVMTVNGQVARLKANDLEIEIKPVSIANDNPQTALNATAIHFETGSPAVLTQWYQTVTSFTFSARM